jgi:class 3 adenylate cyclase
MDIHEIHGGIPAEEVAKAHARDVEVQGKYGVCYHKYWVNEQAGKIFCLCEAPNAEAAAQVHREAHGQMADRIIQVDPEMANLFMGGSELDSGGAVLLADGKVGARDPGIRTILFTDIVDSTSLTQAMGDDAAMEFLRVHDSVVRDALKASNGREIKHTGDGIMASFTSAAAAVRCAAQIQRELAQRGREQGNHPIKVRIGGAAGEPIERGSDIFGSTVQLAARLCSHAAPEQIVVSSVVADLCIGKGLVFRPLGEVPLKGFDRPIHAHAVEWSV